MTQDPRFTGDDPAPTRNRNIAIIALVALLAVLLIVYFATRNSDQDKLGDYANIDAVAPSAEATGTCASQGIYDAIKNELFRRAIDIRGEDAEAFGRISQAAVARMENAAAEGEPDSGGIVNCTGSLAIDLPPGLQASGGRRQLMANVDYSVDTGQNRAVSLRNVDALVQSLAGLARIDSTPDQPLFPVGSEAADNGLFPDEAPTVANGPPGSSAGVARPSFDCARARTRGELAVCSDPGLAELDRAMAAEYQNAVAASDPRQAAALRETRTRFLAYRDGCPTSACMGEAYQGRIREIRDIMAGRWQPR